MMVALGKTDLAKGIFAEEARHNLVPIGGYSHLFGLPLTLDVPSMFSREDALTFVYPCNGARVE